MRIWNEIELYKSGEKSRAFLANNLYFFKSGLAGHASHVETVMQMAPKSQNQVTATAEIPIYSEL